MIVGEDFNHHDSVSVQAIENAVWRWINRAVIGLNLCPFAKAAHVKQVIHLQICSSRIEQEVISVLIFELNSLFALPASERETTLLVISGCLLEFDAFNDFLVIADRILSDLNLKGEIQIASFHPNYQFDGTQADDVSNHTNRSPYPILHLLREQSIEKALDGFENPESIFEANIATLNKLGLEGWILLDVGPCKGDVG